MSPDKAGEHMKRVKALHAHFESLTGNKCFLSYMRIAAWDQFIQRGFTAQDLASVVKFINREMARSGSGFSPASLQFGCLIQDTDKFEDRLNLARCAWKNAKRNPDPPADRKPAPPSPEPPADTIPIEEAQAQLQAAKQRLQ